MNFKRFIYFPRLIELELFIILLLGVTTYVIMRAFKGFRNFLVSTTQSDILFYYGETVQATLELTKGMLLGGIANSIIVINS